MKITLTAFGSRGDIQPFLALAVGLQRAGHTVTLAVPEAFRDWARAYGIDPFPVRANPQEMMKQPEFQAALKTQNILRQIQAMGEHMRTGLITTLEDFSAAAEGADYLVSGAGGLGGVDLSQRYQIPVTFGGLWPMSPTRAFPPFMLPFRFSLGGRYNFWAARLFSKAAYPMTVRPINEWRATVPGLRPWRSEQELYRAGLDNGALWLYAFSPHFLPKPADWGSQHHVTGYWFLDPPPGWQPPADLLRFLESGPPPVYVGFGSMSGERPAALTHQVLEALRLTGQRGLLVSGWGGLEAGVSSQDIFFAENIPHAWLFSRVAAVVHHGGAGTVGAALSAGVPQIVTPLSVDQFAWAERVVQAGVGPAAPPMKKVTAANLAQAIAAALSSVEMCDRAAALGKQVRGEDGIGRAIQLIEQHARGS